jgi:hypothetical protein
MFMQHFTLNLFELVYYCYDVVVLCPFGNLASRNSMFANVCMMNSFDRALWSMSQLLDSNHSLGC